MNERTLTKEDYEKAISFLSTLPEESFIKHEQTLGFAQENIGKFHCVLGHLYLNPASPFYDPNNSDNNGTHYHGECDFNGLNSEQFFYLAAINNDAPSGQIKVTVIQALEKEMNFRYPQLKGA